MTMARTRSTLKKRSAASSSRRKPPEPLVFFIDRSLGRKKVPEALRAAGVEIRVHDELFPQGTLDVDWLRESPSTASGSLEPRQPHRLSATCGRFERRGMGWWTRSSRDRTR